MGHESKYRFSSTALRIACGAAAIVLLAAGSAAAEEEAPAPAGPPARSKKASVAVIPFDAPPEVRRNHATDIDLLYDSLVRIFVKSNKFDVLERTEIQSVIDENQFATTGLGAPENAAQFGKLTGAQYLVIGAIREMRVVESRERIDYTNEVKCTQTARLRLELRVVKGDTGRIVSAEASGNDGKTASRVGACGSRQRLLNDVINDVGAAIVARVVDAIYPLKVVSVRGEVVTLNRGEGAPFGVGSLLDCVVTDEPIVDPDTGDVLGFEETPVGAVEVTAIMPKLSRAKPHDGSQVPVGAICRDSKKKVTPPAKPAAPKAKVPW